MMKTDRHKEVDATPTPREVDNMAAVLEGRHGVHAEHVAQFFTDWNAHYGDTSRSWAWAAVTECVRKRTSQRLGGNGIATRHL